MLNLFFPKSSKQLKAIVCFSFWKDYILPFNPPETVPFDVTIIRLVLSDIFLRSFP